MVEPAEHVFNINRRRLLAGTAAATTAAIVPRPNEPGEAAANSTCAIDARSSRPGVLRR